MAGWRYDANGNLLSDGRRSFTYDSAGRLTQVTQGDQSVSYAYNGDGVLLTQTADGHTTTYTQDLAAPLSQVLQIRQPDQTTDVLYGLERLGTVSGSATTWTGGDALGSTRLTLDDTGAVVGTTSYDAWGVPQAALRAPFGFTGEIHSQGLVYLRARWYDPGSGTFLTRDPFEGWAERPESLHPYIYAGANPITFVDHTGLYFWEPNLEANSWTMANTSNIQVRIQIIAMQGNIKHIHAEYIVPPGTKQVDLLDSASGETWEIEPWDTADTGRAEVRDYITALNQAKEQGLLRGVNPWNGQPYDWNETPRMWRLGTSFTSMPIFLGRDTSGWWDFYATQHEPGLILWWKHRRGQKEQVPHPIIIPGRVAWGNRNVRPGWQPQRIARPEFAIEVCTTTTYCRDGTYNATTGDCFIPPDMHAADPFAFFFYPVPPNAVPAPVNVPLPRLLFAVP